MPAAPPTAASSSCCGPGDRMLYLIWELRSLLVLVLLFGMVVGFAAHRLGR